jgi:hypothetical protein
LRTDRHLGRVAIVVASLAIFLAPFIALLYAPAAGLAIMAAALTVTAYLLRDALQAAGAPPTRLNLLVGINLVLALVCFLVLIALVAGG